MILNSRTLDRIYRLFIEPRSKDPDTRRHEFILNVLLAGLSTLASIGLIAMLINLLTRGTLYGESSLATPISVAVILILYWVARRGYYRFTAGFLLGVIIVLATYYMLVWGFILPLAQLLFVFSIVLAGVLFHARAAFTTSSLVSIISVAIAYMQTQDMIEPNTDWLTHPLDMIDAVGCVIIFTIIGLVTWLANSEIDRSLARARTSEASLAAERDNLEITVAERTEELKEEHLKRVMELQRFSALGKLSASLLHDIANPLTIASLNIEQMRGKYEPSLIKQVAQSLQYIERYVEGARKQLLSSDTVVRFSPKHELRQVINILSHQAKQQQVTLLLTGPAHLKLTGDPIKFSQLTANLILNAIESYSDFTSTDRIVTVTIASQSTGATVTVRDHGKGMSKSEMKHIYEPFYTTKSPASRNMGIGLLLVQQMVEQNFNGKLTVESKSGKGSTFTAILHGVMHEH